MKKRMINYSKLRALWSKFWLEKKHHLLSSHSLVSSDESLLWINSGVAGLKQYFLGTVKPPYKRIFNIQKAVRTNDISQIGKTNRHLSFFEMMGNFSLGDYHKKEAIIWAWEFLTDKKWLNLDKNKLYITIYEKDSVAINICKNDLKLSDQKIILGNKSTNFWDLGVGPCGPNLEIFYDLGSQFDLENKGLFLLKNNIENERYLEIWNIVFSEFLNIGNNQYNNLPTKNIDTGAGLERLLIVLENKNNCFETSLFSDLMKFLSNSLKITFIHKNIYQLTSFQKLQNQRLKIIADHTRTVLFLLSDLFESGQEINLNNKRGYVIKKLIRNASLQLFFLNYKKPFLHLMMPFIINLMQEFYPYLKKWETKIQKIILNQEITFLSLLQNSKIKKMLSLSPKTKISGEDIFILVTEIGLPFSFLEKIAQTNELILEKEIFDKLLTEHHEKSRQKKIQFAKSWELLKPSFDKSTVFLENVQIIQNVKVLAIFVDSQSLIKTNDKKCWVIFDKTPFYSQRGGQISDKGIMFNKKNISPILEVHFNQNNQYLHLIHLKGELKVGDLIELKIDFMKRNLIKNNHSATHLLHFSLRSIISNQIKQNGSLNNDEYLRLDVSSPEKEIDLNLLKQVEEKVNSLIKADIKPKIKWILPEEIKQIKALNFFDIHKNLNKKVRVVDFASQSIELCGGLHVNNTLSIEKFVIIKFKKIGLNNYRIYALTTFKTINDFFNKEKQSFITFLKKYNLSEDQLSQNKDFVFSWNQTLKFNDFYLLKNKKKLELRKQIQEYHFKLKKTKVNKSIFEYTIPQSNIHLINQYHLIWHDLSNYIQQKNFNPLDFLRFVFDKYKNQDNTLLFLFFSNNSRAYNFIFQFDHFLNKVSFQKFLQNYFKTEIKFGLNKNKIQGVIFNLKTEKFLKDFIVYFKNQLISNAFEK